MERALEMLAGGRVAWGALALAAPGLNVRLAGIGDRDGPELRYMVRIFGSRAVALGLGYLLSDPRARRRWRRLCLMVDACDTAAGIAHVVRGDVPRRSAAALTAITGGYAAVGVLALRAEGRPS
ncbi:hypothetical protein ACFQY7_40405 [Actinomadura luteofluorescens]|uniref:DUF4267 domain-containing protein n=1 Tax=Actinomadura luteofluorescens TaxID=46163 RepID=A0A7Y9EI67_9ACTN|nr:hypothetical protein [Actinomadura luteofluorescens]NYD48163.1 hypothetical protein [Actinomadura luteofluorescens]